MLIQSAMLIAGIGTLIQLVPALADRLRSYQSLWVSALRSCRLHVLHRQRTTAIRHDRGCRADRRSRSRAVLGLFAKYWMKIVCSDRSRQRGYGDRIFHLLSVGAPPPSAVAAAAKTLVLGENWVLGGDHAALPASCLIFLPKSYWKQLVRPCSVSLSVIPWRNRDGTGGFLRTLAGTSRSLLLPHLMPFKPEFHAGAIVSIVLIFLVSATETIGDTSAMASSGSNRDVTPEETAGSIACDGFISCPVRCVWLYADHFLQPERRA